MESINTQLRFPLLSTLEQSFNKIETAHLKLSYQWGQAIDEQTNPITLRIQALAIPIICLAGETIKIIFDTKRVLQVSFRSIGSLSFRMGNYRIAITHLCEHLRNIAGIISGIFIALYSPHTARKLFLTTKAEINLQKKLNLESAATLYAVAYAVSSFFEKHKIDYRICHGSLLGAFRHKGIIPWDDDMDIMIHPHCVSKCRTFFESGTFSQETGIEVKEQFWTGGWQCSHPSSPRGEGPLKETGLPFLDVFRTKFDPTGQYIIHDSKIMETAFSEEYIHIHEWENSQKYTLGPLNLTSIKNVESYLGRRYGSEVLDFAFQVLHHDFLASLCNQPFNLISHLQKIWQYDLPRRTYLEDRSPVEYNKTKYQELVQEIDKKLKPLQT